MTRPDRDYDDILSRVLHSALDPVEPAGDGLAKIQKRIAEPWLRRRVSLVRTELAALAWLIFVRCEPLFSRARSGFAAIFASSRRRPGMAAPALGAATARVSPGRHHHTARRGRAGDASLRRWVGPTITWLRPTLAVGGAVVIVVVGVFALGQVREAFINTTGNGSSNSTGGHHHHHAPQPGMVNGSGGPGPSSSGQTSGRSTGHKPSSKPDRRGAARPSQSCSASPSPSPSPTMTSPSPSPTPTSPSPSPTTPTPTDSPTSASGGGSAGSPSPAPGGAAEDAAVVSFGHVAIGSCGSSDSTGNPTASPPSAASSS